MTEQPDSYAPSSSTNDVRAERGADSFRKLSRHEGGWPELAERIGELSRAGLPLPESLRTASELAAKHRHAQALNHVADRLDDGISLAEAVGDSDLPGAMTLAATLETGHRSGDLFAALAPVVRCEDVCDRVRSRVATSLVYPFCVLGLMVVLAATAVAIAHGWFQSYADDVGYPDQPIMDWIAIGLMSVPMLVVIALCVELTRTFRSERLPLEWFGPVKSLVGHARHYRLTTHLAQLIEANVPLPDALSIAGSAAGGDVAVDCQQLAEAVSRGDSVESIVGHLRSAPPVMQAFLATVGLDHDQRDEQGRSQLAQRLQEAAALLARVMEERVEAFDRERHIATVSVLGVGVLGYALAVFGPLIYAYSMSAQEAVTYG